MFKVQANTLEEYFSADQARQGDLRALDTFVTFDQLDRSAVVNLLNDIGQTVQRDPIGSLQYETYRVVSSSVQVQGVTQVPEPAGDSTRAAH